MKRLYLKELIKTQSGATMIFVAICIFILMAFTALAVDLGHLFVAHNELQNAADAGALAGARFLYTNNGQTINVNANQIAYDAATANISESTSVEVNEPLTNYDDVQRGHWSFGLGNLERGFYRSENTTPVNLYNQTTQQLDEDPNHINAVKVITRREAKRNRLIFCSDIWICRISTKCRGGGLYRLCRHSDADGGGSADRYLQAVNYGFKWDIQRLQYRADAQQRIK